MDLISFFSLSMNISKCRNLSGSLRDVEFLSSEYELAEIPKVFFNSSDICKMGWNDLGIAFEIISNISIDDFDSLKLFFNTRRSIIYDNEDKFVNIFEFTLASRKKPWLLLGKRLAGSPEEKSTGQYFGGAFFSHSANKISLRCWIGKEELNGYCPYEFSSIGFSYVYSWGSLTKKLSSGVEIGKLGPNNWSFASLRQEII